jgi:hypothetical protein
MTKFIEDAIIELSNECAYKISKNGEIEIQKIDPETVTVEKIKLRAKELESDYDAKKYQRDRANAFDPITEQLDQIYWDMDGWKKRIKAVKDKFPKP